MTQPRDIRDALEWAQKEAQRTSRPVLVEIMTDREANACMGPTIDRVVEYEKEHSRHDAVEGARGEAEAEG